MPTPDSYIIDIPEDITPPITEPLIKGITNQEIVQRFREVAKLYHSNKGNSSWPYGRIRIIERDIEAGPVENPYSAELSDQQILKIIREIIRDTSKPGVLLSGKTIEEQIKNGVLVNVRTASNDLGYIIGKYPPPSKNGGKTHKRNQRKHRKQSKKRKTKRHQ
jgi:hypothetical protein